MILALETSTTRASLALWNEEERRPVWVSSFTTDRSHNSVIFQPVEEALERCSRKLDAVAVGLGPGSYSGVRVGIAVANGLALSLGVRTIGVSSLEAYLPDSGNYLVVGDARRNTGYIARIRDGKSCGEPELIENERLQKELERVMSDGVRAVTPDSKIADQFERVEQAHPEAEAIAKRAAEMLGGEGCEELSPTLEPCYLRPPFITIPKVRKRA